MKILSLLLLPLLATLTSATFGFFKALLPVPEVPPTQAPTYATVNTEQLGYNQYYPSGDSYSAQPQPDYVSPPLYTTPVVPVETPKPWSFWSIFHLPKFSWKHQVPTTLPPPPPPPPSQTYSYAKPLYYHTYPPVSFHSKPMGGFSNQGLYHMEAPKFIPKPSTTPAPASVTYPPTTTTTTPAPVTYATTSKPYVAPPVAYTVYLVPAKPTYSQLTEDSPFIHQMSPYGLPPADQQPQHSFPEVKTGHKPLTTTTKKDHETTTAVPSTTTYTYPTTPYPTTTTTFYTYPTTTPYLPPTTAYTYPTVPAYYGIQPTQANELPLEYNMANAEEAVDEWGPVRV